MDLLNIWRNGMFGVIVGDALGCPVEFDEREIRDNDPVEGMREFGTFNLPRGSWTDDSSMALAELDSIIECREIDLKHIMDCFVRWYRSGEYTPFGYAFDIGNTVQRAISRYCRDENPYICGGTSESDNGNGSLMRIMPICLYCYQKGLKDDKIGAAIQIIHDVSGLTHNHLRSKIACGLYYFIVCEILDGTGNLTNRLQSALNRGFAYYQSNAETTGELNHFSSIRNVNEFALTPRDAIQSGGYVIDSIEASIWCLANSTKYDECTLLAVNLGDDTDTTAAIAGGLAGLYYGTDGIPQEWLNCIQRKEWIDRLCQKVVGVL
ncbi:MAG: ADP-ribosylglycohydrolase family protein [Salinivirgaceae bacterium]|nr:ADP-ribosylglycohydrolase family protein [Salinivirgaceae bacterium]